MKNTFILSPQSKQKYVLDLLKSNSTIGDTSFVSLSVYLNGLVEVNRNLLLVRVFRILHDLKEDAEASILKEILGYPMIAEAFLNFGIRMAEEGWTLGDLPQRTDKEKALFYILNDVLKKLQEPFKQWAMFESNDVSQVQVLDHSYRFSQMKRLVQAQSRGLSFLEIAETKPQRKLHFTNNPRSEAQAAVQEILQSTVAYEDTSLVCLDPSLMAQVETFLRQYAIPYQKVGHGEVHPIFRFFTNALHFVLAPELKSFIELIHNDVYDMPYKQRLVSYCEAFKPDLENLLKPLDHVSNAFKNPQLEALLSPKTYLSLEADADAALCVIRDDLRVLLNAKPQGIHETLNTVFDFVVQHVSDTEDMISALYTLKEILEGSQFDQLEGLDLWEDCVDHLVLNASVSQKARSGVILTDLRHALIPGLKKQIWLSCTQVFYPQFETNKGLFDEDYVLGIQGYDVKERYDFHRAQLDKIQTCSDEIIYSYALGSYDGKAQRLAYELEKELEGIPAVMWPLVEFTQTEKSKSLNLEPSLAKALYFEKGLEGSVSSFETYFRCPYQYFLKRGLNLREEEELNVNRLSVGNLLHALLEHSVQLKGAQYASYLFENLAELTQPYIHSLRVLFPHEKELLRLVELKSLALLKLSLYFLIDKENSTAYKPAVAEKAFELDYPLSSCESIRFKGILDRLDLNDKDAVIIDYKSSVTSFTESQFLAGLKLQLPTYAWALKKEGYQPKGAFYFSLSPQTIDISAQPSFDLDAEVLKSRRLKGMIFSKDEGLDVSGRHIVGFGVNSKGLRFPTPYNLDALLHELQGLYDQMEEGLKAGNVAKQNKDQSCLYCPYKGFCHYKGPIVKIEHISASDSKVLDS